ncbi:MAG TPA: hypothetical protein VGD86_10775, partial [Devosia sp.]
CTQTDALAGLAGVVSCIRLCKEMLMVRFRVAILGLMLGANPCQHVRVINPGDNSAGVVDFA